MHGIIVDPYTYLVIACQLILVGMLIRLTIRYYRKK